MASLKNKIADYILRKECKQIKRDKRFFNLKNADSFMILYDANAPDEIELIHKYIQYLKDMGKKVTSLGFYNQKELSASLNSSLNSVFLTRKQINWLGIPQSDAVSNLMKTDFDVLINLVIKDVFPLTFVAAKSKALFKIGKFNLKYQTYYDFMIDIGEDQKLKSFMKNVDHYLSLINPKSLKNERV